MLRQEVNRWKDFYHSRHEMAENVEWQGIREDRVLA